MVKKNLLFFNSVSLLYAFRSFFLSFLNVSNRTNWKVLLSKCLTKLTSKNTSFLFQHQNVNESQIDIFIWITFRYSFIIGLTFLASIFVKIHLGKYRVNLGLQKNLMNNCRNKLFKKLSVVSKVMWCSSSIFQLFFIFCNLLYLSFQ